MEKNKKRFKLLLIFLIFLTFLYFAPKLKTKLLPQKEEKLLNFDKNNVSEITLIFSKEKSQSLIKENDKWYVKEKENVLPADNQRINELLDSLYNISKNELASRKKEKHKELGINNKRIELKLEDGKKIILYVGDQAGLQKYYVRKNKNNEVYIAENLNWYPEDWRDLNIYFVEDEKNVSKAEIRYDGTTIVLEKEKNDWKVNSKKADKYKIDFFLSDLKSIRAEDIQKASFQPKNYLLKINALENRKEKALTIFKLENELYAWIDGSKFFYKISQSTLENLKKTEEDFYLKE